MISHIFTFSAVQIYKLLYIHLYVQCFWFLLIWPFWNLSEQHTCGNTLQQVVQTRAACWAQTMSRYVAMTSCDHLAGPQQSDVSFSSVCPDIDYEFRHKCQSSRQVDPKNYFDNLLDSYKVPPKRPQHVDATHRNIAGGNMMCAFVRFVET